VIRRVRSHVFRKELLEMDERLKKTIVGASLFAFGTHTFDLAHEGVIGHEMPSALHFVQIAAGSGVAATISTATVSIAFYGTVPKTSFGNSSTEAVYPSRHNRIARGRDTRSKNLH
jgi:hypothetical protein